MDKQQQYFELMRYVDMLRNLRYDIKRSISYEMFNNTGRLAYRSYSAIQQGLQKVLPDDEYVQAMSVEITDEMTDKEIIWLVNMAAGQLMGYAEGLVKMQRIQLQMDNLEEGVSEKDFLRWVMRNDDD